MKDWRLDSTDFAYGRGWGIGDRRRDSVLQNEEEWREESQHREIYTMRSIMFLGR